MRIFYNFCFYRTGIYWIEIDLRRRRIVDVKMLYCCKVLPNHAHVSMLT